MEKREKVYNDNLIVRIEKDTKAALVKKFGGKLSEMIRRYLATELRRKQ
jgi:hypothetical protein